MLTLRNRQLSLPTFPGIFPPRPNNYIFFLLHLSSHPLLPLMSEQALCTCWPRYVTQRLGSWLIAATCGVSFTGKKKYIYIFLRERLRSECNPGLVHRTRKCLPLDGAQCFWGGMEACTPPLLPPQLQCAFTDACFPPCLSPRIFSLSFSSQGPHPLFSSSLHSRSPQEPFVSSFFSATH